MDIVKVTFNTALLVASLFLTLSHAAQPSAPSPIAAPLRELQWGQLNFLHTTDTHGWHAGHLQQPSYSADWGDYVSFASHLRALADAEGFDLLLVDTGDRIEGNGLYDASEPKGKYTFDIFRHQDIDIICSGNHELYKANSSDNERRYTVPNFQPNYLASNLDIKNDETGEMEPLAPRMRKFTTRNQGVRISAFGFLYDFQGFANNTYVRPIEETIKEQWFQDAIRDTDTDLFVVAGHVPADSEEYRLIFNAIRQQQWDVPIQFFAGHTHIRDFKRYDKKATAMESGRYMETIGFLSIDGVGAGGKRSLHSATNPKVRRKYIDNNLFSLYHHSLTNETTFDTELGQHVTAQIAQAREKLNLDHPYGCAPKNLWIDRVDVQHDDSLFNWLGNEVLPSVVTKHAKDASPKLVLTNTGAMRFDIFEGPFTIDSTYLVSPFTSGLRQIKSVDYKIAQKLLNVLNHESPMLAEMRPELDPNLLLPPEQISPRTMLEPLLYSPLVAHQAQKPLGGEPQLFPGYTTKDDEGEDGDDTLHSAIPFVRVPNCIQSEVSFPKDISTLEKVDLVYNEFIEPWLILALQFLGTKYDQEHTLPFAEGRSMTEHIAQWAEANWPCEE